MAITTLQTFNGTTTKVWVVEATADGDVSIAIPHGYGIAPGFVSIVPINAAAWVSKWVYGANATNIILTKSTDAGSGVAGWQVYIMTMLPHSIIA
jgi:hypothetical protein